MAGANGRTPEIAQPPQPEPESEWEVRLEIRLPSCFGRQHQVEQEVLLAVARAIGLQVRDDFTIRLEGGRWWRYDKFGDDSGHHDDSGHSVALVPADRPIAP